MGKLNPPEPCSGCGELLYSTYQRKQHVCPPKTHTKKTPAREDTDPPNELPDPTTL